MKLQKARKEQVKLRIGISGASGFGKTYSALLLAYGITSDWTKIAVIDSENSSSNLYAELGNYNVINLTEPYSPERYIEAIRMAEKASMEVIIIDSITHEWSGKGGCLQLHEQLGGRFQDWAKITPRHQAFIDAILQSECHIITTVRRKTEFSLDQGSNGRVKVVKLGTKEETRSGYEFELTLNFELINENFLAKASKDRTNLFIGRPEFVITPATGKLLMKWCNNGRSEQDALDEIQAEIDQCTIIEGLRHLYAKYPRYQSRIKDSILKRKDELENIASQVITNQEIINDNKFNPNGTDTSTTD